MELDNISFQLIIEMRRTPLATLNDLASRLNVSPNTIKSRQLYLREIGLIRNYGTFEDQILGERQITDVVGHHFPSKLGLQRIHVVVENVKEIQDLKSVFDNHPYTYYQSSGMSFSYMLYVIFDIPLNTKHLLIEFLDKLKLSSIFEDYFLLEPYFQTNSTDNLKLWRINPNWDFSIDTEIEDNITIRQLYKEYENSDLIINPETTILDTPDLDALDLNLLRELTINSKVSPSDIADEYERDRTTISRRISKIKKEYIKDHALIYNRKAFNLDSTFLIYGHINMMQNKAIFKIIGDNAIPFVSNFFVDSSGNFIWHIFSPTSFCNEIIHELLNESNKLHLQLLNSSSAIRYYFYPNNYDLETKNWKTDRDYFLGDIS